MKKSKINIDQLNNYELQLYAKELFERNDVWGICPRCMSSVIMEGKLCSKCGFDPSKKAVFVPKDMAVYIHRKTCHYFAGNGICSLNDEMCDANCTYMKEFKKEIDYEDRSDLHD